MGELSFKDLKAVLDDNTLDLNMRGIEKIPVKALMKLPRATHLDFSTNAIVVIPTDFCLLTHITHLDLSSNNIYFLPENFGELFNLCHLDLYKNFIEDLPLSFGKLINLKWLDLKNNPLKSDLQKICGDCGDEKACKLAASAVVRYVKKKKR